MPCQERTKRRSNNRSFFFRRWILASLALSLAALIIPSSDAFEADEEEETIGELDFDDSLLLDLARELAEDDGNKTSVPEGNATSSQPTPSPGNTDPCWKSKHCPICKEASQTLKKDGTLEDDQICLWENDECKTVLAADHPDADRMCKRATSPPEPTPETKNTAPPTPAPTVAATTHTPTKTPTEAPDVCRDAGDSCLDCRQAAESLAKVSSSKYSCEYNEDRGCSKVPKDSAPGIAGMCDFCAKDSVSTCEECQEATEKLPKSDNELCYWENDTCSKSSVDKHPNGVTEMCQDGKDPCADAKTCEDCEKIDLQGDLDHVCVWSTDLCEKKQMDASQKENMCGSDEFNKNGNNEDTALGQPPLILGLMVLLGVVCCYLSRRKATSPRHHHGGNDFSGARYEGVATHEKDEDPDDWDWDDDGGAGDVELAAGNSRLSAPKTSYQQSSTYHQERKPYHQQEGKLPNRFNDSKVTRRRNSDDGSGDFFAANPKSPTRRTPPSLAHKKSPPPKPKVAVPPPKEDDIFAEMGFSATPTFGNKPHGLGAVKQLPLDDDDDGDWGDDSDLDDLLDD